VVGADAIFACLGPALEIFSRYARVEKASGEQVTLKEYLEHVWAAVAREALNMVFQGADATGLEPDARLTAMWLWTLGGGKDQTAEDAEERRVEEGDDEEESSANLRALSGFILEYDAARKIAQGLGAHLEQLMTVVEIKGEKACCCPSRNAHARCSGKRAPGRRRSEPKKKKAQLDLRSAFRPRSNSPMSGLRPTRNDDPSTVPHIAGFEPGGIRTCCISPCGR
jgi:hypothetical protein